MLNGLKVKVGEVVRFTMFSNWTFEQGSIHTVVAVGEMDEGGWFDIQLEGVKDWHCCIKFSKLI